MGKEYEGRIIQIMPCLRPMVACYWTPEEVGEVFREPVAFLAIVESKSFKIYSNVIAMVLDNGEFECPNDADNFLGLEYEGKQTTWLEAVAYLKKRREKNK